VNQRERILAGAILFLALALIGKSMYGRYQRAVDRRTNAVAEAQTRLDALDRKMGRGQRAIRQIEGWQARSLPEDREKASSLYRAWLLDTAQKAGLAVDDIDLSSRPTGANAYTAIGYKVKASGSLSAVTAMLYDFYRAPQLHQITRLQLSRPQGESKIAVSLDVEALSLPGAIPTDALPEGDPKRLKLASLDAYQKSLNDRDFVSAYKPPRPPRDETTRREPPKPPAFDDAEQARFSATVGPRGSLQAWINVQTTGETLHVTAGDPIKVGALEGQIVSIEERALVYETGGKKFRVALGQMLRGGKELEAEGATAVDKPSEAPES
jgi:hypothetical protein